MRPVLRLPGIVSVHATVVNALLLAGLVFAPLPFLGPGGWRLWAYLGWSLLVVGLDTALVWAWNRWTLAEWAVEQDLRRRPR